MNYVSPGIFYCCSFGNMSRYTWDNLRHLQLDWNGQGWEILFYDLNVCNYMFLSSAMIKEKKSNNWEIMIDSKMLWYAKKQELWLSRLASSAVLFTMWKRLGLTGSVLNLSNWCNVILACIHVHNRHSQISTDEGWWMLSGVIVSSRDMQKWKGSSMPQETSQQPAVRLITYQKWMRFKPQTDMESKQAIVVSLINPVIVQPWDLVFTKDHWKLCQAYRGFWTRVVYLDYITCLRYTILVRNPWY